MDPQPSEHSMETDNINGVLYAPFSLYNDLDNRIKSSLMSLMKESPTVQIELPLDKVLSEGGLKCTEQSQGTTNCLGKIGTFMVSTPVITWICYVILS